MHSLAPRRDRYPIALALSSFVCASFASVFASSAEIDIAGPPGSDGFGWHVTVLPNGNIVVQDPFAQTEAGGNVGAVYLYQPDGTLISTLRGSSADDYIGMDPVIVLPNGDFLVVSYFWKNGDAANAGAVTQVDATTGLDGVVGADNSLVGTSENDAVGQSVVVLANGNYVVGSWAWRNGAIESAGAATFMPADGSVHGAVSPANSLVGTGAFDHVGIGVVALTNGNYLVVTPSADIGGLTDAGAITWADGSTGIVGVPSDENSLVGSHASDLLGIRDVTDGIVRAYPLANGNAVVLNPNWDNGAAVDAGAATWIDGSHRSVGALSAANSLVGTTADDRIGDAGNGAGFVELPGDRYAIDSPGWSSANGAHVGAITWGGGAAGSRGAVTAANSLVGSTTDDFLFSNVVPLRNGNWIVGARNWTKGDATGAGALAWIDGSAPRVGAVSTANSLTGSRAGDGVGTSIVALANGNYVARTSTWSSDAAASVGAVTWGDGSAERTGEVGAANSLVGSTEGDRVGDGGVVPLANGNYIVLSNGWDNGPLVNAGAATWGSGTAGVSGAVGVQNSIVGDAQYDAVGAEATALPNGHVVVSSVAWHDGVGAATWIDGTAGLAGVVSEDNSFTGVYPGDSVGNVIAIPGRDGYFVASPWWSDGNSEEVGAAAWGDGREPLTGHVSTTTSLVGTRFLENLGAHVVAYANGSTVITGGYSVTLSRGTAPLHGTASADNSVLLASGGGGQSFDYDVTRDRLVVGWYNVHYVAIFQADALFASGFD